MAASNEEAEDISKQLPHQITDLSIKDKKVINTNNDNAELSEAAAAFLCSLNIGDNNESNAICANCGKGVSNHNICNKCKAVAYCNVSCKKKHKSKHKKKCERRVAELHDIELFRQPPPPNEDCLICMLPLPSLYTGKRYRSCCGKAICSGCIHAVAIRDRKEQKCPFCRKPMAKSVEEEMKLAKKRVAVDDAEAIFALGNCYNNGDHVLQRNRVKALELWYRAAELGCTRFDTSLLQYWECLQW